MKRFLNSVLCMCIAVFCTHAQKKNVTSVLEVMDIINPAKRNVMVVKNEMRLLKQKRNVLQI